MQRGCRETQVLKSARTPKAWVPGHLPETQGTQISTSMAPLRICRLGWRSTYWILPANYGFHFESEPRFISQKTDYAGVSEAAGFQPLRSVTETQIMKLLACSTEVSSCFLH